tara:strand:- start:364 stop:642 length:279 start_codon:yes stop_codon:yes gene_type:complete
MFDSINTTQLSAILQSLNPECFGDYTAIAFGIALLISEALPFYKKYCKDETVPVVDDAEGNTKTLSRQPSLLHQSDGILHFAMMAAEKFKKK